MTSNKLNIYKHPKINSPRLLMGLSGWMDGGEVSTGVIKCLVEKLDAQKFAEINPEGFYIYNFPGSMELSSLFRPYTKVEDGLIRSYTIPKNEFFCDENANLILFAGKEPNLLWEEFAECIFSLCAEFGVEMIYFVGSVAGLVPHTREPRLLCSASDENTRDSLQHFGIKLTNYQGPASFITYLVTCCSRRSLSMASLVATIPAYVQGNNPKCIEAVIRRLLGILQIQADLDDLQSITDEFEKKLNEVVQEQPELAKNIRKLEEDYDNEIFDSEMGDLKKWLQQQGIRLD